MQIQQQSMKVTSTVISDFYKFLPNWEKERWESMHFLSQNVTKVLFRRFNWFFLLQNVVLCSFFIKLYRKELHPIEFSRKKKRPHKHKNQHYAEYSCNSCRVHPIYKWGLLLDVKPMQVSQSIGWQYVRVVLYRQYVERSWWILVEIEQRIGILR